MSGAPENSCRAAWLAATRGKGSAATRTLRPPRTETLEVEPDAAPDPGIEDEAGFRVLVLLEDAEHRGRGGGDELLQRDLLGPARGDFGTMVLRHDTSP